MNVLRGHFKCKINYNTFTLMKCMLLLAFLSTFSSAGCFVTEMVCDSNHHILYTDPCICVMRLNTVGP